MDLDALAVGLREFKKYQYAQNADFLKTLTQTMPPKPVAVIGCVDPRLNLNWITSQRGGSFTQHQTLGGTVPVYGKHGPGEEAFFDFIINGFKSEHLILLGHSDCLFVKTLIKPGNQLAKLGKGVSAFGRLARDTKLKVNKMFRHLTGDELCRSAVELHTLMQVKHVMTYPAIKKAVREGAIHLHAMYYDISTANLLVYSAASGRFEILDQPAGAVAREVQSHAHASGTGCLHTT